MTKPKLKSPYPFFGGKSRVADLIWQGLGEVSNYVEPFAGSLAVLLANPNIPKVETVNDIDCFISNFWRAVSIDPEGVAKYADYPVHETDLHARRKWLLSEATQEFHDKMNSDPDFYDLKIAGWWVWCMGTSIGSSWLASKENNSLPALSTAGGGIHGLTLPVLDWFKLLQERTRRTRVCCGDWTRVIKPAITYKNKGVPVNGITGVFLDPPYDYKGRDKVYREENNVFKDVCQWAVENGDNSTMRIVLCGYDGDHIIPETWKVHSWKANGGFGNLANDRGRSNSALEKIYFSPYCLEIK